MALESGGGKAAGRGEGSAPPAAIGAAAIAVAHLRKAYGAMVAVDAVSFAVGDGEIFGVLGPNGAGKTTTVECVVGLRSPDQGTIRVLGLGPQRERAALHAVVGVQLQACAMPAKLTVAEILDLYHAFYEHPADVGELVGALGLSDKRATFYMGLLLALLLSSAAIFALGLLIAAVARGTQMAQTLGGVTFAPLMFFAGLWLPRAYMPAALRAVSNWTPLGAAVAAIQSALPQGFPPAAPLLVLLAYATLAWLLAVRTFRWE